MIIDGRTRVTAVLLDGKSLAKTIQAEIAAEVTALAERTQVRPCLATVLVGDDPASEVYIRNKRQTCERVGMESRHTTLPAATTEPELLRFVAGLNSDASVHGILVQLPLPKQIVEAVVLQAIDPGKDVDCFHPENVGRLVQGAPRFLPCTPHGVQQLLVRNGIDPAGKHVVVVGRSDIVGKPLANMLVQKAPGADATVTVCHSRTKNLADITRTADILVAAIGRPRFITAEMVRPGAVVVDVGINRTDSGLCGDVDFTAVAEVASHITPVPGGVGPLTIAMLLKNTLTAFREQVTT
jgi:methylenetetrahydrofolate dehydrogenase (NADP+)/methenyltetrahydrofolate cyclohydrolase